MGEHARTIPLTIAPFLRPIIAAALIFTVGSTAAAPDRLESDAAGLSRRASADPVAAAALASLTPAQRADDFETVRALRRFLYRRLPLASNGDYWVTDPPVREAATLASAMKLFETAEKGVWCQAAAVLLARLYEAAGYRAWVTSYGDPKSLTHTVTLVQIGSQLYLEDAYFNLDYVRPDGAPLPYFEALEALSLKRTPQVRQDLDFRLGIFPDPQVAKEWTPPGLHRDIVCTRPEAPYLCSVSLTAARFAEVFYIRDKVKAFLTRNGQPPDFRYLMIYPLWTSASGPPMTTPVSAAIQRRAEAVTKPGRSSTEATGSGPER